MSDTTFISGTTITSNWLNDVNSNIYSGHTNIPGTIRSDLASTSTATQGSGMLGFDYKKAYALGTIGQSEKLWGFNIGWVAALDGVTDDSTAIQALHDYAVSLGKKFKLVFPPGTAKCNSGLTFNALYCSIENQGCTLNFSSKTTGIAVTITEHDLIDLDGLRIVGNSSTGSVIGVAMAGTAGHQVDSVRMRNLVVQTFGIALDLGDNCYLVTFDNVILTDSLVLVNSHGTTNAGANIKFFGGNLNTQVASSTAVKNTNPAAQISFFGTTIDCPYKSFDIQAGRVEMHGGLIEPSDFLVTPIQLTGSTAQFLMHGGIVTAGANPVTANALISCDSASVQGANFYDVRLDIRTATRYLTEGTGAAFVQYDRCISANKAALLANDLADGSFENGAVLYGSADGTNKFSDLVSIIQDVGGLPANNLVTGTNIALTFSTAYAHTGTKSLKCSKLTAVANPASFGIFTSVEQGSRPNARIWYKKPGTEAGAMSINMGFYALQMDTNGVPIVQRQSFQTVASVTFTSTAVDWTSVELYDLFTPPWATHYGIVTNVTNMPISAIYFDDAEIYSL